MNKWGLFIASIGFVIIAVSPTFDNQMNMMISGLLVVVCGGFATFMKRK